MLRPEMVMTGCMDVLMKTERGQEVNRKYLSRLHSALFSG